MIERWKVIDEFPDYDVSNLGRVRSRKSGSIKMRKPWLHKQGYLHLNLVKAGKRYMRFVAILVARAFVSNPHGLPEVNHEDGVKTNNCDWNLTWMNGSDQVKHAIRLGLFNPVNLGVGESHINAKLTKSAVIEIRSTPKTYGSQRQLAKKFNVTVSTIQSVRNGRTWRKLL